MKKSLLTLSLFALTLCAPAARRAQTAAQETQKADAARQQSAVEHFAKDGLSFDYPGGFKLTDRSNEAAQHLVLGREGGSVLVMVIAYRDAVANLQQFAAARDATTMPYAQNLARGLGVEQAPTWDEARCIDAGASLPAPLRFAQGFRLAGKSNGLPSTGEVYAVALGRRFVNLVYVRNDKDDAQGAQAWKLLLDTLKVEGPPGAEGTPAAGAMPSIVSGGVLNTKAVKKPAPEYPAAAKSAGQQGVVTVLLTVDEGGNVAEAKAVSGPPLLTAAAEKAAMGAKFKPVNLCGHPVKVSGVVTYNFVLQFDINRR
jgi:TonB family protein